MYLVNDDEVGDDGGELGGQNGPVNLEEAQRTDPVYNIISRNYLSEKLSFISWIKKVGTFSIKSAKEPPNI